MRLTPEGEALNRYCQRIADLEGELASFTGNRTGRGTIRLRITGPSSMMRSRIIPSATAVLEEHPSLVFTFQLSDDESGLVLLRLSRVHAAACR